MLQRIRSFSRGKKDEEAGLTNEAPSKEDIINSIDQFGIPIKGETTENTMKPEEDNNNMIRRASYDSSGSESWMDLGGETEPTLTSLSHSYSLEWEKLFTKPNYLRHLRNYAMKGNLRSSRFRSVCWKLFLQTLPEDTNQWYTLCRNMRQEYEELKDKLIVNPRKAVDTIDPSINNPLSQEDESPWNRFFQDNELRLTIKQDVIRTFPEIEFYHSTDVRELMVNILFCYCRKHDKLSYKQGMHELLAPVIFVLHCDHQAFLHASETESLSLMEYNTREIVKVVMDPKYLEHDAYAMFSQIMRTVEPWYVSKEVFPTKGKDPMKSSQPFARPQDLNPSNVIVTKLTRIQDYLLKKADIELHMHLERHEIAPQIYGIRWIRLLFGREFPMQDLLVLWDAIFADGIGFDLVDYVFVAMLLYIRDLLLSSDYPSCLNTLMRYPPVGDIHFFIEKGRHLRDPNQHPRPPNYTFQSVNYSSRSNRPREHKASSINKGRAGHSQGISAGLTSLTRRMYSSRPKTLPVSGRQKMSKSSSEPMNLQTEVSPVNPEPGNVPQHKRGSSASLSQVEDSMFESAPSAGSLARLETTSVRSGASTPAGFSPDDVSVGSSPTKFATLPTSRSKHRGKKMKAEEDLASHEIAVIKGRLHDKDSMCAYCASKLDVHIERLQAELLHQSLENEDDILVAIAGIKQVRDVLKGTLKFSQNLLDEEEININDNHYKMDITSTSTESEISPEMLTTLAQVNKAKGDNYSKKKKMFYMSSEENSEAMDSPVDPSGSGTEPSPQHAHSKPVVREYELEDVRKGAVTDPYPLFKLSNGPNVCESELSNSVSPSSPHGESERLEESPNPLYRLRQGSFDNVDDCG